MEPAPGTIGFIVILTLYASVGVTAAIGAASVTRKVLPPRAEQVFYAVFLAAIAAIYLAFIDYFGATDAWPLEAGAVVAFCVIAALGARVTGVLMFGYLLHGAWDFAHELQAHAGGGLFEPGRSTAIPLAYGVFCAAFDGAAAVYFYLRRAEWSAAWRAS